MVDPRDTATATLPGIKEPVKLGRKPIFAKAMTAAQRKTRQRRDQDERIQSSDFESWTESDCLRVLTNGKLKAMSELAWKRLGQLKGYQ